MRKFTLFLMSLFLTVGAMAQTSVAYTVNANNGTLHKDGTGAEASWNSKWAFTVTEARPAALTLTTGANNIGKYTVNGVGNLGLAGGQSGTSVYTLAVPEGYLIESYSFNFVAKSGAATVTPNGGSSMTASSNSQTLAIDNINANSVTFTLSGGNHIIMATDFVVNIKAVASVEANKTLAWTTSTPWTDAEGDLSSTVLNDNAMANGIKFVESEIEVGGPRTATVTFRYTSGNCALNIRGVEVLNQFGLAVAGDYHVGKAGGSHENNVYTVKVAEAGKYTVRVYATFDGDNRANATNGNITVAFAAADAASFSHDVTFTAEYATLYLGYQVAIPEGVEAYVVESASDGYAHLVEIENAIPETTAVILKNVGDKTAYRFDYSSENITEFTDNLLEGSIADRYVTGDAYVLTLKNNNVCLGGVLLNKLDGTAFLNNANKAYLAMQEGAEGIKSYSFRFEGGTTGIENVEVENANVIYDLTGRQVNAVERGIYIVNGKKVLVK